MTLPDAEQLLQTLAEKLRPLIQDNTALVGIHSGGAWLVERLLPLLAQGRELPHGLLDISFYRDDFSRIGLHPQTKPSQIPFDVQDRHIILVDDVLYTGRTIRAATMDTDQCRVVLYQGAKLVGQGLQQQFRVRQGHEMAFCFTLSK